MNTRTLRIINTVAFAAMIAVNALANLIPLGLGTTGAVSAKYPTLFTPAPITFAVWGLIYLAAGVFILYQWGAFDPKELSIGAVSDLGLAFAVSCAMNIGWIFAWHYGAIPLSLLFIAGLALSLAVAVKRFGKTRRQGFLRTVSGFGLDLYLGWIIAAALANLSVLLAALGWDGFGLPESFWTVVMLIVGAVIGSLPTLFGRHYFATAGVMWAFIGIVIRHFAKPEAGGYAGRYFEVISIALFCIVIMLCAIIYKILDRMMEEAEKHYLETGSALRYHEKSKKMKGI